MVVKLSKKSIFVLSLISMLFLVPAVGWSRPISIGGTTIDIPDPPGFATVTPQMTNLFQLEKQFITPANEEFICYIAESDVGEKRRKGGQERRVVEGEKAPKRGPPQETDTGSLELVPDARGQEG